MLLKQTRSTFWREWTAKHECEELKEGIWLAPALALLRKRIEEGWTDKHRHVGRKLVLEGRWVQKRLFDIGWSNGSMCQVNAKAVTRRKVQKSTGSTIVQEGTKTGAKSQGRAESGNKKARISTKEWKWQRGIVTHPLSESQWNTGHFSVEEWEADNCNSCGPPAEVFQGHVATNGSLRGVAGKWRACGWSVVQQDNDGELGPLHGCMVQWMLNLRSSAPSRGWS